MRVILTIVILIFSSNIIYAQNVKPYLAIVKTTNSRQKGILQKVDSTKILLRADTGFVSIDVQDVTAIKIREVKKRFKGKNYASYDWDTSEFNQIRDGKRFNKWGAEEPDFKDQVAMSVFGEFFNGIINFIALPIHAINPAIANYRFTPTSSKADQESLSYFSINYQLNPKNRLALKKVSTNK